MVEVKEAGAHLQLRLGVCLLRVEALDQALHELQHIHTLSPRQRAGPQSALMLLLLTSLVRAISCITSSISWLPPPRAACHTRRSRRERTTLSALLTPCIYASTLCLHMRLTDRWAASDHGRWAGERDELGDAPAAPPPPCSKHDTTVDDPHHQAKES